MVARLSMTKDRTAESFTTNINTMSELGKLDAPLGVIAPVPQKGNSFEIQPVQCDESTNERLQAAEV